MLAYFLERARGWRIVAHLAAMVAWFQLALNLSGLYPRYSAVQDGQPLGELPLLDAGTADAKLEAITRAGADGTAYAVQALDVVFALLSAAAFAALLAFGLRAFNLTHGPARLLLLAPAGLLAAELIENGLLGFAIATRSGALGVLAGYATATKFALFLLSAATGLALALAGLAIHGWRRMRPTKTGGSRNAP